jgi:hypothetical protein
LRVGHSYCFHKFLVRFATPIVSLLIHLIFNQNLNAKLIVALGDLLILNLTFITLKLSFLLKSGFIFFDTQVRLLCITETSYELLKISITILLYF